MSRAARRGVPVELAGQREEEVAHLAPRAVQRLRVAQRLGRQHGQDQELVQALAAARGELGAARDVAAVVVEAEQRRPGGRDEVALVRAEEPRADEQPQAQRGVVRGQRVRERRRGDERRQRRRTREHVEQQRDLFVVEILEPDASAGRGSSAANAKEDDGRRTYARTVRRPRRRRLAPEVRHRVAAGLARVHVERALAHLLGEADAAPHRHPGVGRRRARLGESVAIRTARQRAGQRVGARAAGQERRGQGRRHEAWLRGRTVAAGPPRAIDGPEDREPTTIGAALEGGRQRAGLARVAGRHRGLRRQGRRDEARPRGVRGGGPLPGRVAVAQLEHPLHPRCHRQLGVEVGVDAVGVLCGRGPLGLGEKRLEGVVEDPVLEAQTPLPFAGLLAGLLASVIFGSLARVRLLFVSLALAKEGCGTAENAASHC